MAILEDHTAKCSENTLPLFNHARSILLDIPGVHENIYKTYILYTLGGHGFLALYGKKKYIRLDTIYFRKDLIRDIGAACKVKPENEHKGLFHYEFSVFPNQSRKFIEDIIKLAHNYCRPD